MNDSGFPVPCNDPSTTQGPKRRSATSTTYRFPEIHPSLAPLTRRISEVVKRARNKSLVALVSEVEQIAEEPNTAE